MTDLMIDLLLFDARLKLELSIEASFEVLSYSRFDWLLTKLDFTSDILF